MTIGEKTFLTDGSEKVQNPKLSVELYEHQKTAVAALLQIEAKRTFSAYFPQKKENYTIGTNAAVLSERVGGGKTFIILELIAQSPIPRALATKVVLDHPKLTAGRHVNESDAIRMIFENVNDVNLHYTGPNALIHPNLIIVGASVLDQWIHNIREFTTMKAFVVRCQADMKKFIQFYRNNDLRQFHIVLLKNGKYTGDLELKDGKECGGLIYAMNEVTQGCCWSRVIYDDFDTIGIVPGSNRVNALFSIYVSATEKTDAAPVYRKKEEIVYENLADILTRTQAPLQNTVRDRLLFTNFNVRNSAEFSKSSARITILEIYRYVYDNPDDNFIQAIGVLGAEDARETVEALNAGAYATAAQKWGCESRSAGDIFRKMLDTKYDEYMVNVNAIELVAKTRAVVMELEPYPEEKKFKQKVLDRIKASIARKTQPEVAYYDDRIPAFLDTLAVEYTGHRDRCGISIDRVMSNLKEGDCQVCCLPLEGRNVFIVRCCGLIVCDECGIGGNQIALRYNYKLKAQVVCGQCGNCKAEVLPQRDLIFVDRSFDMNSLLKAKGDEQPLSAIEIAEAPSEDPTAPKIRNPKMRALLKIIRGEAIPEREKIPNKIKNLIEGVVDIPRPADAKCKMLLFAGFDETLIAIENFLVEHKIEFMRLGGSSHQLASTVADFRKRGTVLLINSKTSCAGLDLQFATDLVYFHVNTDEHVESQIAGRIQRLNREFNGRIHYLMYKNERK